MLYGEQPGGRGAPVVRSYIHALWARVQTARPDGVVGDPGRSRRGAPAVGGAVVDDGSVDNASPPPRPPSPPPTVPAVADEPQTAGATGRHAPHVPHCTAHCAQWRGGGARPKRGVTRTSGTIVPMDDDAVDTGPRGWATTVGRGAGGGGGEEPREGTGLPAHTHGHAAGEGFSQHGPLRGRPPPGKRAARS